MKHLIYPLLLCCAAPLLRAEIAITPQAGCLCAGAPRQAKPPARLAYIP